MQIKTRLICLAVDVSGKELRLEFWITGNAIFENYGYSYMVTVNWSPISTLL
ncbi:hypothetical protein [Euhalothece natronophila]|uniref:hypothetical protein n=1 Tax=Euhalothece natronophila TaxID=577489 RepID=UPI001648ECA5|nr:hypothetical protein [Euhalothece natronophila]